jgi:transcriptional regulator with XRE-family HTH domain
MTLTTITTPAGRADNLSEQDYRDIYDELRGYLTLAEFVARSGSTVSRAWWSQYESGVKRLSTARRNELRTAVGVPETAPDVAVALSEVTDASSVWRVGTGVANRVIMVTPNAPNPLNLSVNGDVHILTPVSQENAKQMPVIPVTFDPAKRRTRRQYFRPCLALDLAERIPQLRALLAEAEDDAPTIAVWQEPDDPDDYEAAASAFAARAAI